MNTLRFWRSVSGTSFWMGLVVLLVGLAQSCYAQSGSVAGKGVIITQEVAFAWPILVFIVAAAAIWAKMNASIVAHHGQHEIHMTETDIAETFPRRAECVLKHTADNATLARIEKSVEILQAKIDRLMEK